MARFFLPSLSLLLSLGACTVSPSDDDSFVNDDDSSTDDDTTPAVSPWEGVEVTLSPLSLTFGHARIPEGGLALGIPAVYDETVSHDPWNFYGDGLSEGLPDFTWGVAESGEWEEDVLILHLSDGHRARLTRSEEGEGLGLRLELHPEDVAAGAVAPWLRLHLASPAEEGLYGLGETFDAVNQRGTVRAMQFELQSELESGYNEAHVPVPFVLGSSGWGVGLLTDWPAVVDAAATDPENVIAIVNSPEGLDFRLFSNDEAKEIPSAWTRTAGLPRLPPSWALAPMLWRNENENGQEDVYEDMEAIRFHDLAFGLIWIDNPWQTGYNTMVPDPLAFPDWDAMVEELHAQGFRWMAWTTPYVTDSDPDQAAFEEEGLLADIPIQFNDFGSLVDLTAEGAQERWQARVTAAADRGVQGWKLDYGEDIQVGLGTIRLISSFANGQDERTMHHRFVEDYHRAYAEPYEDRVDDRFLLGRTGAWGSGALTDCIWPGDLDSDFRVFGEDGHVGGLPSAIRAGTSLAVSGFPCFASDTGGFRHERPSQEVMARWTEYSALLPVMQVGGGGEDHNYWHFIEGWDETGLEIGRRYTLLHTRLFPFFWTLLNRAHDDGTPPVLPVGLLGGPHVDDEFVVGETLLVAPVAASGTTSRTVYFPPGRWVHWWTGEAWEGTGEVPAPLGEGPLFIREGGIVPLLRESVRTLSPSTAGVDSFADEMGVLTLRLVPGEGNWETTSGPSVTLTETDALLSDPGDYDGLRVEVWRPEGGSLLLDGVSLDTTMDGPWIIADAGPGLLTWESR